MTTAQQDNDFARRLVSKSIGDMTDSIKETLFSLDYGWVVDWVGGHMEPEDVFTSDELERWARHNGYVKAGEDE